jgi:MFS transporter, DHA2 family, multidrug resistance protein
MGHQLLVLGPVLLPEFRDPEAGRVDLLSAGMSLAAVLAVIYGLKQIAAYGLEWLPVVCILVGLAVGAVFIRRQRTLANPLLDLRLFRVPAFSASLAAFLLSIFVIAGNFFFIAQYLQLVLGLSPLEAGLWTLPSAGGLIAGSLLAPLVARRFRPAYVMAAGLVLSAVGFGMVAQIGAGSGLAILVAGSVIFSLGIAPVGTLATDIIVGSAPPEKAGAASGISETAAELGGALGIATLGSIGVAIYRGGVTAGLPAGIPADAAAAAKDTLGAAVDVAGQLPAATGSALLAVARESFVVGLQLTAGVAAVVAALVAAVAAVAMRQPAARVAEPAADVPAADRPEPLCCTG